MSKSQREYHPDLFDKLDTAIAQAGLADSLTADKVYSSVAYALRKVATTLPWWYKNQALIYEREGGRDNVILTIAGFYLGAGNFEEGGRDPINAAKEFCRTIRNQYQRHWGEVEEPYFFGEYTDMENGTDLDGWLDANVVPLVGHLEFDGTDIKDPLLKQAWDLATPKEREIMVAIANTGNLSRASESIGLIDNTGRARLQSLRRKVSTA